MLALAAAGLVVWYVSSLREEATVAEPTRTVLVAVVDIPARTTGEAIVANELVQRQEVVLSSVAPGALSSEAALEGKVLTVPVAKGQQILESQLGAPGEQSLSFRIKAGMRAITIPVDRENGVGGAIREGDRVDVIATFKAEEFAQVGLTLGAALTPLEASRIQTLTGLDLTQTTGAMSITILQQVEVLAMDLLIPITTQTGDSGGFGGGGGATTERPPDQPVITLMVEPADAEKLVFANQFGSVWFTLVPAEDTTEADTTGRVLPNVLR